MINDININNVAYSWNDIEIHFTGLNMDPVGVSSINYNTFQDTQLVYSRQGLPVSRQQGKYESSADITLDYYEMVKLRRFYNLNDIMSFDVKIIYKGENYKYQKPTMAMDGDLETIVSGSYLDDRFTFIDTLYGCRINFPDSLGGEQGEMNLTSTMQLNPIWINYGGKFLDLK